MNVHVKVADADRDAVSMLEIYAHSINSNIATFEETVPSIQQFSDRIVNVLKTHPWLVAASNDELAGYAYASLHRPRPGYRWTAEVSVYVKESTGGLGVGTELYTALFRILREQGFKNLLAIISVPNPASEALHRKFGFERVGEFDSIGYKFGQWHRTCWWQSRIGELDSSPTDPIPFSEMLPAER